MQPLEQQKKKQFIHAMLYMNRAARIRHVGTIALIIINYLQGCIACTSAGRKTRLILIVQDFSG